LNEKFFVDQASLITESFGNVYEAYEFKNSLGEG